MAVDALRPFPRALLRADPPTAARALLGALLVRESDGERRVGRIVEVEAYGGPDDRASHARTGRTPRNGPMFGPAGHAYVYRVYGMHLCLNVVSGREGEAAAVLLRAVEPLAGLDAMRAGRLAATRSRRGGTKGPAGDEERIAGLPRAALASGPGRLGAAFSVDVALSGIDLCDGDGPCRLGLPGPDTWTPAGSRDGPSVIAGPRVGVAYAGAPWSDLPWRFALVGSPAVSRPRPTAPAASRPRPTAPAASRPRPTAPADRAAPAVGRH